MPRMNTQGYKDKPLKPRNALKTLFRMFSYYKGVKTLFVIGVIAIAIYSAAVLAASYFMKPLINVLKDSGLTADEGAAKVKALLIGMAFVYFLAVVTNYALNRIMLEVAARVLYQMRVEMFDRMQSLPIRYFDTHTHGELMSYYTNDIDAIREMLSHSVTQLIISVVSLVGIILIMLVLSWKLFIIMAIMSVIVYFFMKLAGKKTKVGFQKQQQATAKLNGFIEETMTGQKVVKLFNHEDAAIEDFDALNQTLCQATTGAMTYSNLVGPVMNNLSHIFYAITTAVGVLGSVNGGVLIAFLSYIRQFADRLTQISEQFSFIMRSLAGAERVFEVIDSTPETDEGGTTLVNALTAPDGSITESAAHTGKWAWKQPNAQGGHSYTPLKGDVRFFDVNFSYDGKKQVLEGLSLYAKPGQKIAFVGSTGAGKTTITNLINRFYDIADGKIGYDGIDINDIKKDDLRRSLAIVLQETHLFTGTVMENIRYGRLEASDDEVIAAAKVANAHYFITNLPDGYNTMLTLDGANLSQGQRQLLAIARAAVADAPVLILDEATSSIDTRTEKLIESGMDTLMRGRTVFVIAHRLSTVRNADAIIVLEHGKVVERGNHDELVAAHGKYYSLYRGMFELT